MDSPKKQPSTTTFTAVFISLALLSAALAVNAHGHASAAPPSPLPPPPPPPTPALPAETQWADLLKSMCRKSTYPQVCFRSIWPICREGILRNKHPPPKPDPIRLLNISLQVAWHEIKLIESMPKKLNETVPETEGRVKGAVEECVDLFVLMVEEFRKPIRVMRSLNLSEAQKMLTEDRTRLDDMLMDINASLDHFSFCIEELHYVGAPAPFFLRFRKKIYNATVHMEISCEIVIYLLKRYWHRKFF